MIEDKLRLLEHPYLLNDKIDTIIEAFVSYYGEDKREEITQKFKSALILKFINPRNLADSIKQIKNSLFNEIFDIPDYYVSINDNIIDYFNQKDEELSSIDLGDKLQSVMNIGNNRSMDQMLQFLEELKTPIECSDELKSVIAGRKDISTSEIRRLLHEGKLPKLTKFLEEYNRIKKRLSPLEEQVEREKIKEKEIEKKYYSILVSEYKHLFSEEELNDYYTNGKISNLMSYYFGYNLSNDGNCFDDKHEQLLNNPEVKTWIKDNIKDNRIKIIRSALKINSKELNRVPYEDYLKNEEVSSFVKKARIECEMIAKRMGELKEKETIEFVESLEDYKMCRSEIEKRGFINKDDPLGPFIYTSPISCFSENYVKTQNGYVLSPLILINTSSSEIDCTIIHEFNHFFECFCISVDDKRSTSSSGWEKYEIEFKDHKEYDRVFYKGISREYEFMSEYVNDRISQEITDLMHSTGNYLFIPYRGKKTSSYLDASVLLEDFYIKFKEIIIKSRSNNNISYLYEKLGKDNFEELNNIVNEYYKQFGFNGNGLIAYYDYTHGKMNKEAEIAGNLVERKNIIINRMQEHLLGVSNDIKR